MVLSAKVALLNVADRYAHVHEVADDGLFHINGILTIFSKFYDVGSVVFALHIVVGALSVYSVAVFANVRTNAYKNVVV